MNRTSRDCENFRALFKMKRLEIKLILIGGRKKTGIIENMSGNSEGFR